MKFKHIMTAMIAGGLALTATAYADDFTPQQKTQIEGVVHDYLLKNPEILAESIQVLQKKQMDKMKSQTQQTAIKNASVLFGQGGDPLAGNPNGKVTLVEFFDYQCSHCIDLFPSLQALIKANPNLRVVYKEFPIRGPLSLYIAKASLAADKQGKFEVFHEALMNNAKDLNQDKVMELAKSAGLDVQKLKKDMDSPAIDQEIKSTYKLAQDLQLFGTPAMFIAKTETAKNPSAGAIDFIPGQADQQTLQSAIDQAGK